MSQTDPAEKVQFSRERDGQLARLLAPGLLLASGCYLVFGLWELGMGAPFERRRLISMLALIALALGARISALRARPWLVVWAAVAVASVSLAAIGPRLPRAEGFFLGSQLVIIAVATACASTGRQAVVAGAIQLLTLPLLPWFGGEAWPVVEAAIFVVPVLALGAWLASARDRDHRAQFALRLALDAERVRFERLATVDPLTGLLNRRAFTDASARAFELARRHGRALSLIAIDVDHFKRVNDKYGHAAGDRALQLIAERCKAVLRRTDVLARCGGEELSVLLPETDLEGALRVAERLRRVVEQSTLSLVSSELRFTISLGVASLRNEASPDELGERADEALYSAKREGRNRVRVSVPLFLAAAES